MELVTSAYFFRVFIWERDIEATIPQKHGSGEWKAPLLASAEANPPATRKIK
jgi:hypothetical protein